MTLMYKIRTVLLDARVMSSPESVLALHTADSVREASSII